MSEDIVRLTADLYTFVIDSESLTTKARQELNARKFRAAAGTFMRSQQGNDTQLRMTEQVAAVRENLVKWSVTQEADAKQGVILRNLEVLGKYENLVIQLQKASVRIPQGVQLNHQTTNYSRNFFPSLQFSLGRCPLRIGFGPYGYALGIRWICSCGHHR